jgi:long-chain acyl-CoA synthetase
MQNYMESRLDELKKELHAYINSKVNRFSKIQYVILENEPFKKTATQKIKRYLYNRNKN